MKDSSGPNWYALKVFYNKVFEIESFLRSRGIESYIPVQKEEVKGEKYLTLRRLQKRDGHFPDTRYVEDGAMIKIRKPLVTSLMFFHATEEDLLQIKADSEFQGRAMIYSSADRSRPAVIPDREMAAFRLVADSGETGLTFFSSDNITRYRQGDRVRVKCGPLKGAEGYIKRIKKDRRLLVSIEGIVAVATSFIPPEDLEVIEDVS